MLAVVLILLIDGDDPTQPLSLKSYISELLTAYDADQKEQRLKEQREYTPWTQLTLEYCMCSARTVAQATKRWL